ncbi:hypothetical protein WJ47_02780 [Burkholderia ubonensis]|uniref:Uncharacterized protein n=1 Tax=Burkholderia ubonensis TaxID=101571 RepID=A0AB73FSS8_9BURK|nr:hypothetical protein [Burkholderia ubonensis]KVK88738.1 hypothetical protein WJ44_29330 [Burkholderia ubonensis]KVL72714.1 hypothetical protein WJ47_02780 [Burkholderia ubonensis]KVM23343.1 hypothetical protein WJ53_17850 [Burkholderia ubonensis]KVM29641.1 hypothetical protein WJ54_11785 [Burkholderia ubonensis]
MTTQNEKSPAPEQASEAATTTAATDLEVPVTAEAIVEQAAGAGNLTSSKIEGKKIRADALTDERHDALQYAIQVLQQIEAGDGTFVGQCADAISGLESILAASPVEQPAAAPIEVARTREGRLS